MTVKNKLLSIIEVGGYPDFSNIYQQAGFQVLSATSMRKALSLLKKEAPAVVVAEFNFQSDFRDRTSSLESLLATIQGKHPETRVIIFYEKEHVAQINKLKELFDISVALTFPIDQQTLLASLNRLSDGE
jgi:DNA-binding NtrC family response regulator